MPSADCWDHRFTFDRCCFLGEARFGGGPLRIAFGVSWLFVIEASLKVETIFKTHQTGAD